MLPILHLNGYKIANPTVLARISHEELEQFLRGCGWTPHFRGRRRTGNRCIRPWPALWTWRWSRFAISSTMRGATDNSARPRWPMIVLKSPKGWTGPKVVDGLQIEGTFRAHQVPLSDPATHPEHLKLLEEWLRSYRPEELFDAGGA